MQNRFVKVFMVLTCLILFMVSCSSTGPSATTNSPASTLAATNSITLLQPTKTDQPVVPADIIFYNGNIITIEKSQPLAQAIAVRGKLIQATGSDKEILTFQGSDTVMIDLQGKTLMPGFIDTHRHTKDRNPSDFIDDQQLLVQSGITTVSYMYVDDGILATVKAMGDSEQLRARTSLYLVYAKACGEVVGNWYQNYPPTHEPGEMLRIAGVKVYADGGSCGRPATSFNRLNDGLGDLWFTQDEMNTIVKDIDTAGYQGAIHAIGDRAVDQALNAIEFALNGRPNTIRHRIEHNTTVNPNSYPRYQKIGVVATVFGNIWSCNAVFFSTGIVPDPPEYQAWNFAYQAMLDASPEMHLAWHTDYPWASSNPLFHLYSLATPYEIAGDLSECGDPSWIGNKTVSLDEALSMMTIEGAYALFREKEVGSLLPGKYADLIILSGNPKTDLNTIKDLQVWMTMVGGHVEWCAPGQEAFCPATIVSQGTALS
ncbi:MAG: amidohydrolase family protein, partial [Anaerolineaceae bacterium]